MKDPKGLNSSDSGRLRFSIGVRWLKDPERQYCKIHQAFDFHIGTQRKFLVEWGSGRGSCSVCQQMYDYIGYGGCNAGFIFYL